MPDTNDPQQDESRLIDRMMTDLLSTMDQDDSDMRSTLIENGDDIRALAKSAGRPAFSSIATQSSPNSSSTWRIQHL
ncbi:hypothetical protein [Pseudomonas veronii]|uniref:Uncharacterized protein n=1 Tax=Pseudomonas veronii TaxID=76761 RepID=A0A4P7YBU4_PSEVE|nr:hypothetical protein [Pseudomonas veronii]QCG68854.1 hypothetical protein E4167_33620 [Pseudomonas veronii]